MAPAQDETAAAGIEESAHAQAWGRFFSASGRSSNLRLALALALASAAFAQAALVFDPDSFAVYAAGGALFGAILAKVVAETGRRLHDADWPWWTGWIVFGAILWFFYDGMTHTGEDLRRPQHSLALALVALLLLWPGSRGTNRWGTPPGWLRPTITTVPRRAGRLAAASVIGFASFTCALLSISHGMRDNQRRIMEMLERERSNAVDVAPAEDLK